jgi:glycerol-3-phosphate dehydrogenase
VRARCVVNATGVWVDGTCANMDGEAPAPVKPMVAPSQGVHLVVDREFLPGDHALMVPKTPTAGCCSPCPGWARLILGTTDTRARTWCASPSPLPEEVAFILNESARYLARAPQRSTSRIWVGLRPLGQTPQDEDGDNTKSPRREHTVLVGRSGLVTVTGGKWTTYRAMAEDVLQKLLRHDACLPSRLALPISFRWSAPMPVPVQHPHQRARHAISTAARPASEALPGAGRQLGRRADRGHGALCRAVEYARTVEDVLARRSRLLFLDARLAIAWPLQWRIVAEETGMRPPAAAFEALGATIFAPAGCEDA